MLIGRLGGKGITVACHYNIASGRTEEVRLIIVQLLLAPSRVMDCLTTPALRRDDDDKHINSSVSGPVLNITEQLSCVPTPALVLASQIKEPGPERVALVVLLHLP